MKQIFVLIFGLLLGAGSFASGNLNEMFDNLKDRAVDYTPTGQVCEQVARVQFSEQYPTDRFDLNVGVEYGYQGKTIGELDLVVTDKNTKEVVLVGEVKCWRDAKSALSKALNQRARFIRSLKNYQGSLVFDAKEGVPFSAGQFVSPKYVAISQEGTKYAGFDAELGFSLNELMTLRDQLMQCQSQGQCPRP